MSAHEIDINIAPMIIAAIVITVIVLVALGVGIYFLVKAINKDSSGKVVKQRIICRQCGSVIEEGVRFCAACGGDASNSFTQNPVDSGTNAKKVCMHCGSEISGGARFCKYCGKEQP
ncbi:MAG: zinc-ribbon domain-containing protein [Dehalococcoidales bacterium]|nr:zinc-ribbon domain-containing protein [Dehalococcoidales bacterium]